MNAPRLNRAQVRSLKRKLALRARLTNQALEARYGIGRKAIWEYATGKTPAREDWRPSPRQDRRGWYK